MSRLWWSLFSLWAGLTWASSAFAAEELKELLDRLLALPTIQTTTGFTAKVFVPPGSFYDPFDLHHRGGTLLVSDDGKEEEDKGGQIFTVYCPLPEKGEG